MNDSTPQLGPLAHALVQQHVAMCNLMATRLGRPAEDVDVAVGGVLGMIGRLRDFYVSRADPSIVADIHAALDAAEAEIVACAEGLRGDGGGQL